MPRDVFKQNFLYGNRRQEARRTSIWGCKRPEASPTNTPLTQDSPTSSTMFVTSGKDRRGTPRNAHGDRRSSHRLSRDQAQTHGSGVRFRDSEPSQSGPTTPSLTPSQPPPFTMHPFSQLTTTVTQCPWMLGSDINAFALDHSPDFYPPVPRSLKHDTAVSFVVTDQTRPEQPQFVISCPLEHVDLVREMLAPTGSQRTLNARGSSGHPRDSGELKSMLLDGTPNIELTLHHSGPGASAQRGSSGVVDNQADSYPVEGGGWGSTRRQSFVRERPSNTTHGPVHDASREPFSQESGASQGFPTPFVPAMLVPPHGWYAGPGGFCQGPRVEQVGPPFGPAFVNT